MRRYGLIGYPLTHSFSQKYFTEKFEKEGIPDSRYDLFELPDPTAFPQLIASIPDLVGLNVTIPHKQAIIPYLDELDPASAGRIGAVNTIRILPDGRKIGYNTDYYGFRLSLEEWFNSLEIVPETIQALVLGNGGAAKAVTTALTDLHIRYRLISRQQSADALAYEAISPEILEEYRLIVNTSPVGTYPNTEASPAIPYGMLTHRHLLYDLVYNPAETRFLQQGREHGATTHNGLPMLHLQAEKAWEIWNL
ncbi:shikimate dehydrogenase family protein [Larkinella terrae]|uniref:Shikimate dehydrogenase n=1 Tax=Larkinella terrae TaxID=2025311 RepID=A0A7K0EEI2_9BACT|nr:shikimate dehydrogenase [Larkinella terrae]MRS60155.1 shikimate dehydrogenase [Larkinella terrae]